MVKKYTSWTRTERHIKSFRSNNHQSILTLDLDTAVRTDLSKWLMILTRPLKISKNTCQRSNLNHSTVSLELPKDNSKCPTILMPLLTTSTSTPKYNDFIPTL